MFGFNITLEATGLAESCIHWRSTLIKKGTRKLCAAYDDLDHFASIQLHSVDCLHVCGRLLEAFLVAQYYPLVRFDLACRSDARHSDNWRALMLAYKGPVAVACPGLLEEGGVFFSIFFLGGGVFPCNLKYFEGIFIDSGEGASIRFDTM